MGSEVNFKPVGIGAPGASPSPKPTIPDDFAQPGETIGILNVTMKGRSLHGTVSKVDGPGRFYIVTNAFRFSRAMMSMEIQNFYKMNPKIGIPSPGLLKPGLCVACFEDGKWLRAKILRVILQTHCRVQFVDSGHFNVIRMSDIRYLGKTFMKHAAYASECRISPIVSGGDRIAPTPMNLETFYDKVQPGAKVFAKFIKLEGNGWNDNPVWEVKLKERVPGGEGHPYYDVGDFNDTNGLYCIEEANGSVR